MVNFTMLANLKNIQRKSHLKFCIDVQKGREALRDLMTLSIMAFSISDCLIFNTLKYIIFKQKKINFLKFLEWPDSLNKILVFGRKLELVIFLSVFEKIQLLTTRLLNLFAIATKAFLSEIVKYPRVCILQMCTCPTRLLVHIVNTCSVLTN